MTTAPVVIVMGVSGSGKTTIGRRLAEAFALPFFDADDWHSPESVAKMRAGTPLTDADRWPWLDRLNALLRERAGSSGAVLACSALKAAYRDRLRAGLPQCRLVHLTGDRALIAERLAARRGHYMNPALLDSQFATLEPPADAITASIAAPVERIVGWIVEQMK